MPTCGSVSLYELEVRVATACHAKRPRSSPHSRLRLCEIYRDKAVRSALQLHLLTHAVDARDGALNFHDLPLPVYTPQRGCNSLVRRIRGRRSPAAHVSAFARARGEAAAFSEHLIWAWKHRASAQPHSLQLGTRTAAWSQTSRCSIAFNLTQALI